MMMGASLYSADREIENKVEKREKKNILSKIVSKLTVV
jgi:hypothetical protein